MKSRAMPIFVSLLGACLIGLLVYGVTAQSASRTIDELIAKGETPPAPNATRTLPVLSGHGVHSLASLRGKVVVLNFWASWCVPCQVEAPLLEQSQAVLERHNATVLGVSYLDASPDSLSFMRHYHLTYPMLRDNTGDFAHAYGTDKLPESFIINRRGQIVALERGEIEQKFLDRAVALAERS